MSQMIVFYTKGNTTKNAIMHITAIITRCRNLDILLSEKGCVCLVEQDFQAWKPCLDKIVLLSFMWFGGRCHQNSKLTFVHHD